MSLIEQYFEVGDVKTTIPEGMSTNFKVSGEDLRRIEETTSSLEGEKLFDYGLPSSRPNPVVSP